LTEELKSENKNYKYLTDYLPLDKGRDVILHLTVREGMAQFFYGYQDEQGGKKEGENAMGEESGKSCERKILSALKKIGPCINASFLSDEACNEGWFTGAMIGICCQDLTGFRKYADFDWFEVRAEKEL